MKVPHSYHNTTGEKENTLAKYENKALTQDEKVLEFFKKGNRWNHSWSPSEVWIRCFGPAPKVPLTSVRRAISNLTKEGKLVRTEEKVNGPYGRNEYRWRLK